MGTHPIFESDFDCLTDRLFMSTPISNVQVITNPAGMGSNGSIQLFVKTAEHSDADLWPNSFFRSSKKRFLAVVRTPARETIVTDIIIVNESDQIPTGFSPVQSTYDTGEEALKGQCVCLNRGPLHSARSQVTDLVISTQPNFHLDKNYTYLGEVNNLHLSMKRVNISQLSKKAAPTPPIAKPAAAAVSTPRHHPGIPQRKHEINPLDGVTFKLADNVKTGSHQASLEPGHQMPIKHYDDILAEHFYDFSTEQKAIS